MSRPNVGINHATRASILFSIVLAQWAKSPKKQSVRVYLWAKSPKKQSVRVYLWQYGTFILSAKLT